MSPTGGSSTGPEPDEGPHPHYTHDGRRFWTGAAWIEASDILDGDAREESRPAPAVPATASPAAPAMRWRIAAASILIAVLVAAGFGHWALGSLSRTSSSGVPSAESILNSPFTHHVRNATFSAVGIGWAGWNATGEIFFRPKIGFAITERIDGALSQQFLDVDGLGYERDQPGGAWHAQPTYPPEYFDLGWDGGGAADRDLQVGGPVRIRGEEAWHLWDGLGNEWWIGVANGRPLEVEDLGFRYIFSNFGKAPGLQAPARAEIATGIYPGQVGQAVATPAFSVLAGDPRVHALQGYLPAPQGYRYLSLRVSVTNRLATPAGLPLGAPVVTSAQGGEYWQDTLQESQTVADGTPALAPGASESGTLVFVVAKGVKVVRLLISTTQLQPNPVLGDYLVVITVHL